MQQNYTIIFQDVSKRAALIHISRNKNKKENNFLSIKKPNNVIVQDFRD